MRFSLSELTQRVRKTRRTSIAIRPIAPPAMQATNLYRDTYAPIVAVWNDALPGILATYERSLAQITTDSPADLRVEIENANNAVVAVTVTARTRLERWAQVFEAWHRARWRANVKAATGVDLGLMIGPADARLTLDAVIERNVALVSSVSNQTRERISDAVFRGLRDRRSSANVGRDIRDAVDMSRRRARNIASDQLSKLSGSLDDERRRQAGIMAWEWVHSGKTHYRPEHLARNGFLYSDAPALVGDEYQGKTVKAPPTDLPGQLPYCGCTSRAVLIL